MQCWNRVCGSLKWGWPRYKSSCSLRLQYLPPGPPKNILDETLQSDSETLKVPSEVCRPQVGNGNPAPALKCLLEPALKPVCCLENVQSLMSLYSYTVAGLLNHKASSPSPCMQTLKSTFFANTCKVENVSRHLEVTVCKLSLCVVWQIASMPFCMGRSAGSFTYTTTSVQHLLSPRPCTLKDTTHLHGS